MSEKSFFYHQLQEIAKTLIIAIVLYGIIGISIQVTQKCFLIVVLFNIITIFSIRFFIFKRSNTTTFVEININDGNVIIPKGALITNIANDLLFETVREYRFRKEENNEN